LIFFVGGINGSGVGQTGVGALDIRTNVYTSGIATLPASWTVPVSSAQIGDEVYIATTDSGGRRLIRVKLDVVSDSASYAPAVPIDGTAFVGGGNIQGPGLTTWDGELVLSDHSNFILYNELAPNIEQIVGFWTFPSYPYGSKLHTFDGNIVHIGGSSTAAFTNASDEIGLFQIGGRWARERSSEDLLYNFKTRQGGKAIGFKAGQPYGAVCYNGKTRPEYILMSDEIV